MFDVETEQQPGHSTGPTSAEGKQNSSGNAVTHGMCSKGRILSDETPEEYEAERQRWERQYRGTEYILQQLREELVDDAWLLRRAKRRIFTAEQTFAEDPSESNHKHLQLMQRYRTTAKRDFDRSWQSVERYYALRRREWMQEQDLDYKQQRRAIQAHRELEKFEAEKERADGERRSWEPARPKSDRNRELCDQSYAILMTQHKETLEEVLARDASRKRS